MSRYEIEIGKTRKTVELEPVDGNERHLDSYLCAVIDEKIKENQEPNKRNEEKKRITVERRDHNTILISIDEKMYLLRQTKRTRSSVEYITDGRKIHAQFPGREPSQTSSTNTKSLVASVNELVSSNFPAKVVSIKVSKGNRVREGDTILILEAMKMEAQIKAPRDCDVVEVLVHEGDMVARGAKLVQLKFS